MIKKGFFIFFFLIYLALFSSVLAQQEENIESCFNYYDYGKIRAHLTTEKTLYKQGEIVNFQGTIINNNTFPLVDIVLYAQLKRSNTKTSGVLGRLLVDRLTLAKNLNFLPGETKWIKASLSLSPTYPNGTYETDFFLFSKPGFHYGGRPFLEGDTAGYATFEVSGGIEPVVSFDTDSLKVNGGKQDIYGLIKEFETESLSITAEVIDQREVKSEIPATVEWYKFEDAFSENLIKTEQLSIQPNTPINLTFIPPEPGAYVMVLTMDSPVRSLLKYRFAKKGDTSSELRMNDLGVTNFPATGEDRAYVCFHSPTNSESPETQITLSILDSAKNLLDQKTILGTFSPEVSAISLPLTKLTTPEDFWVKAVFIQPVNPKRAREIEVHYDCNAFKENIRLLDVSYDPNLNVLFPSGKNICGKKISIGGYIEYIRIKQNDQIKKEIYNLASLPETFSLKNFPAGSYQAEIKSGEIVKKFDFTIPSNRIWGYMKYILLLLFFPLTVLGIYLWKKKKKTI